MPAPNYFRRKPKKTSFAEITGGLTPPQIRESIEQGAHFVAFQYVISAILISSRCNSKIIYLPPGEKPLKRAIPYTALTALFGWWSVPHGIINTPAVIYKNLRGGTDITAQVAAHIERNHEAADVVFMS